MKQHMIKYTCEDFQPGIYSINGMITCLYELYWIIYIFKTDVWNLSEEKHPGISSVPQGMALMALGQTIFVCSCVCVLRMGLKALPTLGKHSISVLHAQTGRWALFVYSPPDPLSSLTPLMSLRKISNIFKEELAGYRGLWSTGICIENYLASLPINKGCLQGFQYSIGIFWGLFPSISVGMYVRDRGSPCNPGCIQTHYVTKDGLDPPYSRVLELHMSATTSCFFYLCLWTLFLFI